jgi:hypothetical protein
MEKSLYGLSVSGQDDELRATAGKCFRDFPRVILESGEALLAQRTFVDSLFKLLVLICLLNEVEDLASFN